MLSGLLAAGALAGAYAVGHFILTAHFRLRYPALPTAVLSAVTGIAVATPLLVLIAAAGLFSPGWLGAVGWTLAAMRLGKLKSARRWRLPRVAAADALVIVAAVTFVVISASGRDETLGSGRDQQLYAASAIALATRGNAWVTYAPADEADRMFLRNTSNTQLPGSVKGDNGVDHPVRLTHPMGWPVWLAIAHAIGGTEAVFRANAVVFGLGGLAFYALLRLLMRPPGAAALTVLLFGMPASLWIAGISLSEPLSMLFMIALPLVAASGVERSRLPIGILLFSAALVRIDAAIAIAACIGAAIVAAACRPSPLRLAATRRFCATQGAVFLAICMTYLALYRGYLDNKWEFVGAMAGGTLALAACVALLRPAPMAGLGALFRARTTRIGGIAILLLLFGYAAWIRPQAEPFSIIRHVIALEGTRDFREDSLVNLAAYLSWPLAVAALLGVCGAIWKGWMRSCRLDRPLLLLLGIGAALLYLWWPHVSPDFPWGFRRFIPVVVPFSILFAAVGMASLAGSSRGGTATSVALVIIVLGGLYLKIPPAIALHRDDDGMTRTLDAMARELPDTFILSDASDPHVAGALSVAYGKHVAISNGGLEPGGDHAAVDRWLVEKARLAHPALILHGPELPRIGMLLADEHEWTLVRRYVEPATRAPATRVVSRATTLTLSRSEGLDDSFPRRMFGAERVWGAPEAGFLGTQVAAFGAFRDTDGDAWIEVPAQPLEDSRSLKIDLFSDAPPHVRRHVVVKLNDVSIWDATVASGVSSIKALLPHPIVGAAARIRIMSAPVSTREPEGGAPGTGGVAVIGIRAVPDGESAVSNAMAAFRSRLVLERPPAQPMLIARARNATVVLAIANAGSSTWPTAAELGDPVGAVNVALRWQRLGTTGPYLADNRTPMQVSLLPGDTMRVLVALDPIGTDGRRLAPGRYDVRIGMVREGVAHFSDHGDPLIHLEVEVGS